MVQGHATRDCGAYLLNMHIAYITSQLVNNRVLEVLINMKHIHDHLVKIHDIPFSIALDYLSNLFPDAIAFRHSNAVFDTVVYIVPGITQVEASVLFTAKNLPIRSAMREWPYTKAG